MNQIKETGVKDVVEDYKKFKAGTKQRVQSNKEKLIKEIKELKWKD